MHKPEPELVGKLNLETDRIGPLYTTTDTPLQNPQFAHKSKIDMGARYT